MIKDTDEHPGEEIHGEKSGSVPYVGTSVSVELEYTTVPVHGCVHQPRNSPNPILLGFYGGCIV